MPEIKTIEPLLWEAGAHWLKISFKDNGDMNAAEALFRAALAATPQSGGVVVKGLEWRVPSDNPRDPDIGENVYCADGVGGVYAISKKQIVGPERLLWHAHDSFYWTGHASVADAKAAAQADHESRIRSTLAAPIPEAPADEEVEGPAGSASPEVKSLCDLHMALLGARRDRHIPWYKLDPFIEQILDAAIALEKAQTALRRSTETDKPGVREAALEEAAKVADMFAADHAKSADQFGIDRNRELHNAAKGAAQGVAFAIRALSAPLAAEQPAADRDGSERYLDWNDPADAIAPLPRSTTGGAK